MIEPEIYTLACILGETDSPTEDHIQVAYEVSRQLAYRGYVIMTMESVRDY